MTRWTLFFGLLALMISGSVSAAADLEVNTPAISSIKQSMQDRHGQLAEFYTSGAVGLTRDGQIAVHDAGLVPLSKRQQVNSLVADENRDRSALYREIARANGHPEWESEVRSTFADRWVSKAASGWWYQNGSGSWVKK
ncbi:YdbL family protein [Sulfurirhabdus autotrophica]